MAKLRYDPMRLGPQERGMVDATIREVCAFRGWSLLALNVRTNHLHALVYAEVDPERVMNDFKSWSTRRLREHRLVAPARDVWTSHGSTRHLWKEEYVEAAYEYVVNGQGPDLPQDWPPDV
jgi:REP element-mobilizing transposase RayT